MTSFYLYYIAGFYRVIFKKILSYTILLFFFWSSSSKISLWYKILFDGSYLSAFLSVVLNHWLSIFWGLVLFT
jgi:hypothetical protein